MGRLSSAQGRLGGPYFALNTERIIATCTVKAAATLAPATLAPAPAPAAAAAAAAGMRIDCQLQQMVERHQITITINADNNNAGFNTTADNSQKTT